MIGGRQRRGYFPSPVMAVLALDHDGHPVGNTG
jgi:flavin reductase (DIM6/NTAB) family NADH-FMN oxidoreductase RutF